MSSSVNLSVDKRPEWGATAITIDVHAQYSVAIRDKMFIGEDLTEVFSREGERVLYNLLETVSSDFAKEWGKLIKEKANV